MDKAIAYVDGGSRGNPGDAAYGVFVCDPEQNPVAAFGDYIGTATNNQAEYSGLLAALEWALEHGVRELHVNADSQLMVRQMNGRYRVKSPNLKSLFENARSRANRFDLFRIEHVYRDGNAEADRLANLAMDCRGRVDEAPGEPGAP